MTKVLQQMQEEISDQGKFVECLQFQFTDRNVKGNFPPQVVAISNDGKFIIYLYQKSSYVVNKKGKVILQVESIEQYFKFTDDSQSIYIAYFIKDSFRILFYNLKKQELQCDDEFRELEGIRNFTILYDKRQREEQNFYFTIKVLKLRNQIFNPNYDHKHDTPKIIPNKQKVQIQGLIEEFEGDYQYHLVYCGYRQTKRIRKQYLLNFKTQAIYLKNGLILTSPNLRLISARDGKIFRKISFPSLKNSTKAYIKGMHFFVLFQNGYYKMNLYSGIQYYGPLLNPLVQNSEKPKKFKISPTEFLTYEQEVRKTHVKRIMQVKVFKLQP